MDTKKVDLNLLVALDALLAERNVTRAARRLGLSDARPLDFLRRASFPEDLSAYGASS